MALRYDRAANVERRGEAVARVMEWVRALIGDDVEMPAVSAGGHACGHAACAGNAVTILTMRAGEAVIRLEIAKPLETVTQADVGEAFAPLIAKAASLEGFYRFPPRGGIE